ncbi:MAG TPA: T9SS type A sorting domain-containing protein [Ignavibacteria bacterium]|nr:T9SS type A sorting domain-containing protein [Ignavibacteria bacterium]
MLLDIDCDEVNPLFWFSGNPFKQEGWIHSKPVDQRHFANTESFELIKGEPQDIIISITVGHGYNYISELAVTRELVRIVFDEWNSNFASAINFEELVNNPAELTYSFILEQNYPNPFNPVTTIRYSVPGKKYLNQLSSSDIVNTTLIIYDILGREIKTLVNESKIAGTYEITFEASRLASGVYLYRLTSDSFSQTKKMMVIK